jgi:hypothetical protein
VRVIPDDLISDSASRSNAHGGALLDALKTEAKALGRTQLVLDTGIANVNAQRSIRTLAW